MRDDKIIRQMNEYYSLVANLHDYYMDYSTNENMEKLLSGIIRLCEKDIVDTDLLEIACGTGNWTQVLAKRARTVFATDINESMLKIARAKIYDRPNVRFERVDAYRLDTIKGDFNAAFAADFWSHIPRAKIRPFLKDLHARLRPGARVVFLDMLPDSSLGIDDYYYTGDGDFARDRVLADGSVFTVVKNFPDETEIRELLMDFARDIRYYQHLNLKRWLVSYSTLEPNRTIDNN